MFTLQPVTQPAVSPSVTCIFPSEQSRPLTVRMKLVVLLFILHVSVSSAGLFSRHDLLSAHRSGDASGGRSASGTAGSPKQGRRRPLFARRGQYERQRIHAPKLKVVPVAPKTNPPPKVAPKPARPKCSQLTQSCVPQSGCCDKSATCHCHFFNAICFCRNITL